MGKIEFPLQLKKLLEDSELQAPIRALADRTGEILAVNKLDFFPYYTDHGIEHIQAVLKTEVELVPKDVWKDCAGDSDPRLLCDADAAVIIGATLLHDLAMHLSSEGFRELVAPGSRFQPLPWFRDDQEGRHPDRPWDELWSDYVREARKFSERDLTDIIGEKAAREWKFETLPKDAGRWEENHRLIVGEFIRRHHARLAHEIAIYGFPGLPVGVGEHQFPAMGSEPGHALMRLADLIGLTARSHGTSMRVCQAYLDSSPFFQGTPRPMEVAVLYPMALLRVADYLQIDRKRAPVILLQLRRPQSPISVSEWDKHQAVQSIVPAKDPRGKMITVSPKVSLPVYLQLQELITGLQREIDHATAVLDENYGTFTELGLHQLNLSIRRVHSNLELRALRDSLPYVPQRTGFSADPNLLTLLVKPLYGDKPNVGIRELMQNAIDAVCEREAWCENHGKSAGSLDLPKLEGDVQIDFIERPDGTWLLRVQDSGIGMTGDTLQNYYLRAGASFRRSSEWSKEFLDEHGRPRVLRSGRFGIGAFAVFLLSKSFKLWTRHIAAGKAGGFYIEASENSQLIEMKRIDGLPVGTMIEMELTAEIGDELRLVEKDLHFGPEKTLSWYCLEWPNVVVHIVNQKGDGRMLAQLYTAPLWKGPIPPEWSEIRPAGFDRICWTFQKGAGLVCNGIVIGETPDEGPEIDFPELWELQRPQIYVFDSGANLPVTTQRYRLLQSELPFGDELFQDVLLSFIAHALVCGPSSPLQAFQRQHRHPLSESQNLLNRTNLGGNLHWCHTKDMFVPADPWLYSLLGVDLSLAFGLFERGYGHPSHWKGLDGLLSLTESLNCSLSSWLVGRLNEEDEESQAMTTAALSGTVRNGFAALGHRIDSCRMMIRAPHKFRFQDLRELPYWMQRMLLFDVSVDDIFVDWGSAKETSCERHLFEAASGDMQSETPLEQMLSKAENALDSDGLVFAAEIHTKSFNGAPESLIAKVWNECLGPQAIPFELSARQTLIKHGRQHPELRRHIEAWEKMKSAGSKWALE